MAYSRSPVTLIRRKPHIEPMFRGETQRWIAPFPEDTTEATTWAYKIRECLYVAKRHPGRFPTLARNAERYYVEVLDEKTVQASISNGAILGQMAAITLPDAAPQPITFSEAISRFEIVQCLLRTGAGASGPLYFPNATLAPLELSKLATWAISLDPAWTVVQSKVTKGTTLVRKA